MNIKSYWQKTGALNIFVYFNNGKHKQWRLTKRRAALVKKIIEVFKTIFNI